MFVLVDSVVLVTHNGRQVTELEQQEQQQETQDQQTETVSDESALNEQGSQAPETQATEDAETLKKRLADTQAWAHKLNQELKQRQQQEEAQRLQELQAGLQPEVFNAVDQAIEAREIRARQEHAKREAQASQAIYEFEPQLDSLKEDPVFVKAFNEQCAKLTEAGKDVLNPIYAVKAVAEARKQYDMSHARREAEEAERARKTSKLSAMDVPGSGATAAQAKGKSESELVAEVWNMSAEEFAKRKMKARGF